MDAADACADGQLTPAQIRSFRLYRADWTQAYGLATGGQPVPAALARRLIDAPVQAVIGAAHARRRGSRRAGRRPESEPASSAQAASPLARQRSPSVLAIAARLQREEFRIMTTKGNEV